jgi:hypothetical protein
MEVTIMYHIRRADNHDERSIHIENTVGFSNAVIEAIMRTSCTGVDHEIVDDNGNVKHVVEASHCAVYPEHNVPDDIDGYARVAIKPWRVSPGLALAAAIVAAMFFARLLGVGP